MLLRLKRLSSDDRGTFGVLLLESDRFPAPFFVTAEPPWNDNENSISCIPPGKYPYLLEPSHKFGRDLYELKHVPERSEIKLHWGNYWDPDPKLTHTDGCILIGSGFGEVNNKNGIPRQSVLSSKPAFDAFMVAMKGVKNGQIWITDRTGNR